MVQYGVYEISISTAKSAIASYWRKRETETRNRWKECNERGGTARGIEEHSRRGRREGGETFAILRDFRGISDGKR